MKTVLSKTGFLLITILLVAISFTAVQAQARADYNVYL